MPDFSNPIVLSRAFGLANTLYIAALAITVLLSLIIWVLASKMNGLNDTKIRQLQHDTAIANQKAADATERSLALEVQLEQERVARLQIEERLAPRRIDETDFAKLVSAIRPLANQTVIFLVFSSPEVVQFGQQVEDAFTQAGVRVTHVNIMAGSPAPGMMIEVSADRSKQADLIERAFTTAKVITKGMPRGTIQQPGLLQITIGPKPS
jgi:hypothetical protein